MAAPTAANPITFQVIHSSLLSAAREMGSTMLRTAYSVIFSEGYDFSCALLNESGDMVATANYCPVHLAAIAYASSWSIMEIGIDNIYDGDVLIHNDPYRGGTHVTDVNVIKPIFFEETLIGFAANRAHQLDMGGKTPGSFAGDATEIFQEGIRIPPIKWFERGVERTDVFDLILSNVRLPRTQLGDFKAQLASVTVAERRVQALCAKYGVATVQAVMREIMDYSERRMRAEIAAIPDGVYTFADLMDNDGITPDPVRLQVTVTVAGDSLTADYTGSSEQVQGPINATYGVCASSTYNALLECSDPSIPVNAGAFRPVKIVAPRGSVVNPRYPAPVQGGNTNTSIFMVSLVLGALAQAVPNRVLAASGGTCNDFTCGGEDPEKGPFVFYWFPATGWGALPERDGWSAISDPVSNCSDTPIELMETLYPFRYLRYELNEDAEGAGRHRGGYGITQAIELLAPKMTVAAIADRHVFSPYGLFGGHPARPNQFRVRRGRDGRWWTFQQAFGLKVPSKFSGLGLAVGDAWEMSTTGGGGYGDPLERDPELVLADVQAGLVSPKRARDAYGVVVRRAGRRYILRELETKSFRARLRQNCDATHADDAPIALGNGVVVDARSAQARRKIPPSPPELGAEEQARIMAARAIAVTSCPGPAPGKDHAPRCPWFDEEMLRFWSADALEHWTRRRCPAADQILPTLTRKRG
jgi:N-methylhydantoinase B/oxoprolinase/acetone carboxylase alpha subunit